MSHPGAIAKSREAADVLFVLAQQLKGVPASKGLAALNRRRVDREREALIAAGVDPREATKAAADAAVSLVTYRRWGRKATAGLYRGQTAAAEVAVLHRVEELTLEMAKLTAMEAECHECHAREKAAVEAAESATETVATTRQSVVKAPDGKQTATGTKSTRSQPARRERLTPAWLTEARQCQQLRSELADRRLELLMLLERPMPADLPGLLEELRARRDVKSRVLAGELEMLYRVDQLVAGGVADERRLKLVTAIANAPANAPSEAPPFRVERLAPGELPAYLETGTTTDKGTP